MARRAPRLAGRRSRHRPAPSSRDVSCSSGSPRTSSTAFPIELSGGMKQRVVMVLSSILDPSLLIADEVTSALDVSTQRAVAELLVEFRDRGFVKSMIVITHDLSVLSQIADTILVMYAGKLAEKARTDRIVDMPRHPYTRLLLSSLPEVGVRYAERRLQGIAGRPPVAARAAGRLPLPGPLPGRATEVRGGAAVPRGRGRSRRRPAGGPPDAEARHMLQDVPHGCLRQLGAARAVSDVSFEVAPGEVVALIGESGSGKSTIGKMILRLVRVTRGTITFDGVDIATLGGPAPQGLLRRRAGRVPGSVQLVQPDLQSRPRVHASCGRATSQASARPSGTRSWRGRWMR